MIHAHLFREPIGDWQPKVGDKVAYSAKPGSQIREGRILASGGKFYLVEVKFNVNREERTKQVHAEIEDLRLIRS